MDQQILTDEQIITMTEFVETVAKGLEVVEEDSEARRGILDALDVSVKLAVEDEEQVIYVICPLSDASTNLQGALTLRAHV